MSKSTGPLNAASEIWPRLRKAISQALKAGIQNAEGEENPYAEIEADLVALPKALHDLLVAACSESGVKLLEIPEGRKRTLPDELISVVLYAQPDQDFAPVLKAARPHFPAIAKFTTDFSLELQEQIKAIIAAEFPTSKRKELWVHHLFLGYAASWPVTVTDENLDFFAEQVLNGHPSWSGIAGIPLALIGKRALAVLDTLREKCPEAVAPEQRGTEAVTARAKRKAIISLISQIERHQTAAAST